jgi:cytochrome c5
MRHTRSFLVALSSVVPLIATAGSSTAQEAKPSTVLGAGPSTQPGAGGADLYARACAQCHNNPPSDRARRLATHSKSVRPKRWLMP